jgi:hypothetical protein
MNTFTLVSLIAGLGFLVGYVIALAMKHGRTGTVLSIFIGLASMCFFSSLFGRTMSFWEGAISLIAPIVVFGGIALGWEETSPSPDPVEYG